jgi:hypothetical protein
VTLGLRDLAFLGGGAPAVPWTPAQLGADLRLWLDADDASTITLNGSTVSQWRDKSGLANHMDQAIAVNQMTYQTGAVNGRAAVVDLGLPGANAHMQTSAVVNVNFNGSGMSMFGVGRTDASANNGLSRFVFVNNRIWLGTWFTNSASAAQHGSVSCVFGNGATWTLRGTSLVAWEDTLRIVGATVTSGGSSTTYNDGSTGATFSMGWANFAGRIGLNHVSGGSQQWRGPMCELVMMVNVLGTSDREKLEGYLAHKWQGAGASNNLPAGHPYKAAAPTV